VERVLFITYLFKKCLYYFLKFLFNPEYFHNFFIILFFEKSNSEIMIEMLLTIFQKVLIVKAYKGQHKNLT
jgi:hypothetical protein